MKEKKRGLLTNALRKAMKKSRNDNELLASLATASKELDDEDLFLVAGGAQYEASKEQLQDLLGDNSGLTAATQSAIMALINDGGAVAVADASSSGSDSTAVGLVSQKGGTEFTDATYTNVQTAVFDEGAAGKENLTSDENITTEIGNVHGLAVNRGNDNNAVMIEDGQASVNTGDGADLFNLRGEIKGEFTNGNGNGDDEFMLDETAQKNAEISIDAGEGFDLLTLLGNFVKHQFSFKDGQFHMK